MRFSIPKLIIILGVIMVIADSAYKGDFMCMGIINPWLILVIGFDAWFLEKVKPRTLAYIDKIKDYPVDKLINKRIKF
jgi:hypothetical protein